MVQKVLAHSRSIAIALILVGSGLLVYNVLDWSEFGYDHDVKLRIALGAMLVIGGAFLYRHRRN